jgi:hypothetical protein
MNEESIVLVFAFLAFLGLLLILYLVINGVANFLFWISKTIDKINWKKISEDTPVEFWVIVTLRCSGELFQYKVLIKKGLLKEFPGIKKQPFHKRYEKGPLLLVYDVYSPHLETLLGFEKYFGKIPLAPEDFSVMVLDLVLRIQKKVEGLS